MSRFLVVTTACVLAGLLVLPAQADERGPESEAVAAVAAEPTGLGYSVSWSRVAGGGRLAEGGAYTLHGTVGQHEVQQVPTPAGSSFSLRTGFWIVLRQTEPALVDVIFRDRFRNE